jgi:dienelactone hydrolase
LPITSLDGSQANLEAMVVRPDRSGRFPVVVIVHGTPRASGEAFGAAIAQQSPVDFLGPAVAFAQRGYAAVSIMRRGFGRSDGQYAERLTGSCENRDYLAAGRAAAEDVTGAVRSLRDEPWADPDRVLLFGLSTGGFAVTAAAAGNPPGVVGIVNVAGVHGSAGPDRVCSPDRLVEDVSVFGQTSRLPALWIYVENDHFVPAALSRRMFEAYTGAGAPAALKMLPPFGNDGHYLLSGPIDLWWSSVEGFLDGLHLPISAIIEMPALAAIPPPSPLNPTCMAFFKNYAAVPTDTKAFAWNAEGHCSTSFSRTADEAKENAMRQCRDAWKECTIYAVGQSLSPG